FGSLGYSYTDLALNHLNFTGVAKNRTYQFGVREQTITGAQWQISNTFVRSWDDATTGRWYQNDLNIQVTQPLLRDAWPEFNLAALKIARLNHKITMSQFRQQVEETVTEVMTAYYLLIQARREVEIAQELLQKTQETYTQVKGRRRIDATKVNISQALAAVKTREALLVQTKKVQQDTQDALARLLSDNQINMLQDYEIIPTTQMSHHLVKINQTDQLLTALRLNTQLEQARLGIQQADINVRVAKNQTLPSLNITAGAVLDGGSREYRGVVWNDTWSGRYVSYNAALEFEYPIGNRERKAALAETRLTRKQMITQMQNTADAVAQTIRERIRQVYARHIEYLLQGESLD
ncbi:MAG: TolC family protein, partial [Candidatus Hydrogenedentes bacterium]|nr:TolC family protein [Candidatus Hydrogenedentota bacterium]